MENLLWPNVRFWGTPPRPRRSDCLDLLAARHPEAAEQEAHWFGLFRTEDALLRPDGDVLAALLGWIPHLKKNVEFFEAMFDRLRFHNRVQESIAAAVKAWPILRAEREFIDPTAWFLSPAVHLIVDHMLESRPELSPDDPALRAALVPFAADLDEQRLRHDVSLRSAPSPRPWHKAGFLDKERAEEHLYLPGLDFRDALHARLSLPSDPGLTNLILGRLRGWHNYVSTLVLTDKSFRIFDRSGAKKKIEPERLQ